MHDIDSTRLEASPDQNEYQGYQEFAEETGDQGEDSFEMPMTEGEEEALAAELLGVSSEEEMDQFFGKLFRKIGRGIRGAAKFLGKNAGPLSGVLKGIAKKALPFVGGALGTAIPIPGLGTALGATLGGAAANLLESETDHLEVEEREFQMAKRFVRLASQAVRQGARMPAPLNPTAAANLALRNALQRLRRTGGFRARPIYRPCPPCAPCPPPEPCPTCSQPLPATDFPPDNGSGAMDGGSGGDTEPGADAGAGAADNAGADAGEFGYAGEDSGQGEGEYYETDNEAPAAPAPNSGRGGRWVRRGRKIVLYGL